MGLNPVSTSGQQTPSRYPVGAQPLVAPAATGILNPSTGQPVGARDPYFLESSVPGVFVAGDVRSESAKRVAAAVGEGSMAVMLVHRYLAES